MTDPISKSRKPGKQNPGRYTNGTGPNYSKWGEQAGYVYVPQYDRYFIDPASLKKQYQDQGILPPDAATVVPPSLLSQLAPVAAAGLVGAGAKAVGENLPSYFGSLGGLFGSGSSAATPSIESAITSAAPAQYGGLFGQTTIPGVQGAVTNTAGLGAQTAAAPGMFSLGNIGAEGNFILPAAGGLLALDVLGHNRSPVRGGLEGAASGAAIGSGFGGLPGAAVGAGIGGLIGLGKGLLGGHGYSNLEEQKREALAGQGINLGTDKPWERNAAFAKSRDVNQLQGSDIINAADWYSKLGPAWQQTSPERQAEIAQEAIRRGLVNEHNGGIDINTAGIMDFLHNQPTPVPRTA